MSARGSSPPSVPAPGSPEAPLRAEVEGLRECLQSSERDRLDAVARIGRLELEVDVRQRGSDALAAEVERLRASRDLFAEVKESLAQEVERLREDRERFREVSEALSIQRRDMEEQRDALAEALYEMRRAFGDKGHSKHQQIAVNMAEQALRKAGRLP